MNYVVEVSFLVRLLALIASVLLAIFSIFGILIGIVNLALSYPITIIVCIFAGYVLAVIGMQVLFPTRGEYQ